MNIELSPVTVSDYAAFFGRSPDRTIKGYAFWVDGDLVAVCGALLDKDATMLFSDVKEGFKAHPIVIYRWAKKALRMMDEMKQPLYATSQKSGKFLCSLGFVFLGDTKHGKLYQYLG